MQGCAAKWPRGAPAQREPQAAHSPREMASGAVTLLHSAPGSQLDAILRTGLQARSAFEDLGLAMRRGVVYCWLKLEHDKMWGCKPHYVHVEVTVDASRCRVADMEFASIALMYLQGQGGKPRNIEAAALLARLYELTSVPLSEYREGMFWTPEVLVRGDIAPADVTVGSADGRNQATGPGPGPAG